MRRAFTMIEMLFAVFLVGVLTTLSVLTFNQVSRGWQVSTDYMDKMQRTDFALNQVISGLRSMYYPHDGQQDDNYGFVLINNGDGEDPDSSDIIEWSKTGSAIVGTKSAVADTVHRVQVMILEEGNDDYRDADGRRVPIEVTGLYARQCPDVALRPKDGEDDEDVDYTFENAEMYQPVLIADGIVGFNCRVLKDAESRKGSARNASENDADAFEDEFSDSGDGSSSKTGTKSKGVGGDKNDSQKNKTVPYKLELTFRMADPEGKGYRSNTAPIMRIIRIPIHEQSLDGNATPDADGKASGSKSSGGSSGGKSSGGTTGGKSSGGSTGGKSSGGTTGGKSGGGTTGGNTSGAQRGVGRVGGTGSLGGGGVK